MTEVSMTEDKLRCDLPRLGARLALQTFTIATMAASTLAGYLLYGLVEETRFERWFADGASTAALAIKAFSRMDPTLAMLLVPALTVGGLALGGMYVWGRQSR
jgi:hypothetical protein